MSIVIKSWNSTVGNADVDSTFNLQTNSPYTTPTGVDVGGGTWVAWFSTALSESDAGSVTGTRRVFAMETTWDYRLRVGLDTPMWNEYFPWTALNTSLWASPVTTSTVTVTNGQLNIDPTASLVSGAVARVTSYRSFPLYTSYSTAPSIQFLFTGAPVANKVHEFGFIIHTGVAAPTEGMFMRIDATGNLRAVLNNNSVETQSDVLDFNALIGIWQTHTLLIYGNTNEVVFWIDNICVATIPRQTTAWSVTQSQQLPISFRTYNTATVTGTPPVMKIGAVNISLADMNQSKAWSHVMAGGGWMSYQGQTGQTLGSTALYSNNLAAGAGAVMTNTTAALGSWLGGQFTALPTLAVGTDGILSSYQVPVWTSSAPWKSLYITGVSVYGAVTTALVGNATPVVYAMSLAFWHNLVNLTATVSTVGKAPVRKPLGFMAFGAAATVGTVGLDIEKDFDRAPVVVFPWEFVQVVAKNLGAVTTTGAITFLVDFEGYWE